MKQQQICELTKCLQSKLYPELFHERIVLTLHANRRCTISFQLERGIAELGVPPTVNFYDTITNDRTSIPLLELTKGALIDIVQSETFAPIHIKARSASHLTPVESPAPASEESTEQEQ